MSGKFSANPYYVAYESRLKALHQLMAAGDGDTKEADAVRDEMDRPEQELSREELERLNGLSADLYMLQDEEIFEPPGEVAKTPQQLAAELEVAWRREDWERVLELLRQVFRVAQEVPEGDRPAFRRRGLRGVPADLAQGALSQHRRLRRRHRQGSGCHPLQ